MNSALSFILLLLLLSHSEAKCRHKTFKLTEEFCANIPTAQTKLDRHAFAGVWFQIFLTTDTDVNQINSCTTAQYELQPDNTFSDLNCEFDETLERPRCLDGTLVPRKGGGPGSFTVEGSGDLQLDFVALLGSKSYGYFAAAAFQCNSGLPRTPGYFILARKPIFQRKVLHRLKKKLRCLGFPIPKNMNFALTNHKGCKYFFNKSGFDLLTPEELAAMMMNG